jgi:Raf kinase inhibitor-like YbhB/YbcL family protein
MKLTSPAFTHNSLIPKKYTCDGEDINPPLLITNVSKEAKSLALIVDDPDAPRGTWTHWTVWNINPGSPEIIEDSIPSGAVLGMTDFGEPGYGGPCPPSGTHRYFFRLYALDAKLELQQGVSRKELERAMAGHILSEVELIGLYRR